MSDEKPWLTPEGKKIWKTEAQYWGWLRGAIRRIWADYPLRKEWKKQQLRPVTQEEREANLFHTSTRSVGQCFYCKEWFPGSRLECDHKVSSMGCTSREAAEEFLWYCGGGTGSDWVLACKPCHKAVTHAERKGIGIQEAVADKKAILLCREKRDKEWLQERGIDPASNQKGRREQIVECLMEEEKI